jgi:hypothetical protein
MKDMSLEYIQDLLLADNTFKNDLKKQWQQ